MTQLESVLIAGVNGGFGRLFSSLLTCDGREVLGVDLGSDLYGDARCARYFAGDVTEPDPGLLGAVRRADCLLLCVPEDAALRAIERLLPELASGALLVDTLSVKSPVAKALASGRDDVEALSLNPLFAPDLGFEGQNVAAVDLRPGARADELSGLLRGWGARVVHVSAAEHDRRAALVQAAAHAALLAYGLCLDRMGYTADLAFSTPPQRVLLSLLARVVSRDPEVYWRIQADNPYADEAREQLARSLEDLAGRAREGDGRGFEEIFASVRRTLEPALAELLEVSRPMLS